jgi:hypothetical protein
VSANANATQMRRRTCSPYANRAQSATRIGPTNWITSAMPISTRWIAKKYDHCTSASPPTPSATSRSSSFRRMRSDAGRVAAAISVSPISAPTQRTSVSCCELMPEPRITFETVPLTANSVAAAATIVYPSAGRMTIART